MLAALQARQLAGINALKARAGLSDTSLRAVQYLAHRTAGGERVRQGELATYLGVSAPTTSTLVENLKLSGYLDRVIHAGDRRVRHLVATAKSLELLRGEQEAFLADVAAATAQARAGGDCALMLFLRTAGAAPGDAHQG